MQEGVGARRRTRARAHDHVSAQHLRLSSFSAPQFVLPRSLSQSCTRNSMHVLPECCSSTVYSSTYARSGVAAVREALNCECENRKRTVALPPTILGSASDSYCSFDFPHSGRCHLMSSLPRVAAPSPAPPYRTHCRFSPGGNLSLANLNAWRGSESNRSR